MNTARNLVAALALFAFNGLALADACGPDCGKVTAVNKEKHDGKGSWVGTVAGGVAGGLLGNQVGRGTGKTVATVGGAAGGAYAGHEIEKKMTSKTVYKVKVQLDNGQTRSFEYGDSPAFAVGDRVRINNGKLERYSGQ